MKLFESDRFELLVDELERCADDLVTCERDAPLTALIAAVLTVRPGSLAFSVRRSAELLDECAQGLSRKSVPIPKLVSAAVTRATHRLKV